MSIKFLTLNTWNGGVFFDAILSFVQKENPDIVCFQEVYNGKDKSLEKRFRAFEIFKKELGFPHSIFAPALRDMSNNLSIDRGNAVFQSFP